MTIYNEMPITDILLRKLNYNKWHYDMFVYPRLCEWYYMHGQGD